MIRGFFDRAGESKWGRSKRRGCRRRAYGREPSAIAAGPCLAPEAFSTNTLGANAEIFRRKHESNLIAIVIIAASKMTDDLILGFSAGHERHDAPANADRPG